MQNNNKYISALLASGLSIIPVAEGKKNPHGILGKTHDLLTRRATQEKMEKWLAIGVRSWGAAGGAVSGNLVTLDFDQKHYPGLYDLWYEKLSDDQKAIVNTCYKNSTRNKGVHLRYKTQTSQPTIKLARRIEYSEKNKKEEIVTTAETRGEGAYALIPPSDGYTSIHGSLLDLPLVPNEIHEEFIDLIRVFNEVEDEPETEYEWKPTDKSDGDRPGDRFNQMATWKEILEPHGWVEESKDHWRRPGKDKGEGISATTNYDNRPMFYVFSTSAHPFQANRGYSKFSTFTLLNHNGDYKAAAKAAARIYPQNNPPLPEKEPRSVWDNIKNRHAPEYRQSHVRNKKQTKGQALTKCFADIQSAPISWFWEGRIALGKLTMIAGDPGLGKSFLTASFAAHSSRGFLWPVDNSKPPIGDVILLSAEDDPADTIKPRLEAMEADCSRIHIIEAIQRTDDEGEQTQHMFSFVRDVEVLAELLSRLPNCKLVIIDPVSAYLDSTDSNNNSDIRGLLAPLSKLAEKHKVAIILVSHLNKNSGGNASYRVMGSLAFTAAVRTAYIVTKDQNNPARRLFMPLKNNIAKDNTGLAYSIIEVNGVPVVAWEPNAVEMTTDEALDISEKGFGKTATDDAVALLRYVLFHGAVKVDEIMKEARQAGIKDKPLRTAREKLNIQTKKIGFNPGYWVWELPEDDQKSEDAPPTLEGILDDKRHLRKVEVAELPDERDNTLSLIQ